MPGKIKMPGFNKILAEGFVHHAGKIPFKQALFIGGKFYSYDEILEKAEILSAQLSIKKIPPLIGIYTVESVWTYAAILAISLNGACYVPLNVKLPSHKLQGIARACNLKLIISEVPLTFSISAEVIVLDKINTTREKIEIRVQQEFAYLLFTSGSTGDPKGVPISKKNCTAFFEHYHKNFDFNSEDKFLQPYELSFDVSVFSIFAAWNAGACVYVVPDTGFKYLDCVSMIRDQGITVSSMVPVVLQYTEKYLGTLLLPSLRYSFFSGDKLYQHLAKQWQTAAPNTAIYNCYGPTETTIVCTSYRWQEKIAEEESLNNVVPLGTCFETIDYILLDECGHENNTRGEICFSGAQVIDAYLNGQHSHSFFTKNGRHYYKTGDFAQINKNGNLLFLGRNDSQVKINGFRVELGEIESAIFKLVKKNTVLVSVVGNNLNLLVAFVESDAMSEIFLKEQLREILPSYMIPANFIFLSAFPQNINGKTDRQQLKQQARERAGL